jgi:hypothetical protein
MIRVIRMSSGQRREEGVFRYYKIILLIAGQRNIQMLWVCLPTFAEREELKLIKNIRSFISKGPPS